MKKFFSVILFASCGLVFGEMNHIHVTSASVPACYMWPSDAKAAAINSVKRQATRKCQALGKKARILHIHPIAGGAACQGYAAQATFRCVGSCPG